MRSTRATLTVSLLGWIVVGFILGDARSVEQLFLPIGGAALWLQAIPTLCLAWVRTDLLRAAAITLVAAASRWRHPRPTRIVRV